MCVQGLIQGVHDPKDVERNIVLVGRGDEYYLFKHGRYQTSSRMLARMQVAYEKLVAIEKANNWSSVKTIVTNAFGFRVLT